MKRLTRSLIAAAVVATSLGVFALPAHATLGAVRVYQRPCASYPCPESNRVPDGGAVYKDIQIETNSSSNQWAEIQIRKGSGNWICVKRYANPPSLLSFTWKTSSIPGPNGCEGSAPDGPTTWGAGTTNDVFGIRVVAQTRASVGSGQVDNTDEFHVKLNNAPPSPELTSALSRGNGTKQAYVELRWSKASDPEIVQYEVIRQGPGGTVNWFVSASNPSGDDCPSSSSTTYVCRDVSAEFRQQGFEATYHYEIKSFRRTEADSGYPGVSRCSRGSSGYCVASQPSNSRSATVTGPPVPSPEPVESPSPSPSGPGSPSSGPSTSGASPSATKTAEQLRRERELARVLAEQRRQDYLDFFTGEYDDTLPFDQRDGIFGQGGTYFRTTPDDPSVAAGPFTPPTRDPTPYRAAAGGSLMLLVAAHMARLLKRSQGRA